MIVPDKQRAGIRTQQEYQSFEMSFEWMASAKSNSGVKYRVFGLDMFTNGVPSEVAGYEYQVADDEGDPGARIDARQKSGSI